MFRNNGFYRHVDRSFVSEKHIVERIDYKKFHLNDVVAFQLYINQSLLYHEDFPSMSELLGKKINKSILEIFNNAYHHGKSEYVYTCGHYSSKNQLFKFTISDMGKTIRKNVNEYMKTGREIPGKEAIEWAVIEGNTTKNAAIPGGLGLSLIRDFLKINGGSIQIVSSNGYWYEKGDVTFGHNLENTFIGTIVNLEFNLDDQNMYILAEEIDYKTLF